ncbi:ATP-binding protein [Aeromonas rivipollensis]|uniref:ATP-binding protein n=1 Tax=Aeromonas TaxID=642 RepID=UPI00143D7030|nr:ATP-binding protein [Aeromonas media]MBS4700613.1 ATP-binding protein [Aeromonas media]QIY88630.1 ATP-binding protein [Aeromonas hydrophila]
MFDFTGEQKIIDSGVRNIYTPYQPITTNSLFFGRKKEIGNIVQQLNTPGQHSVLFGDRGVGKSSLANIVCDVLSRMMSRELLKKRCDSHDKFETIVESLLQKVGCDLFVDKIEFQKEEGGNATVKIPCASAGIQSKTVDKTVSNGAKGRAISPSWVAEKIKGLSVIFLLDEIDVIDEEEKWKIAELVKQLSDEGSQLKFLIVGIAETATELTHGHPSVQRCLKETRLPKMSASEIDEIILSGADKIGLEFTPKAIARIRSISSGYAHFTHLLALKSAEVAITNDRKKIDVPHIKDATDDAMGDAEGTLRTKYNEVVRSSNTKEFVNILISASMINKDEFTASELRHAYMKIYGQEKNQGWFNNFLKKIVSDDKETILKRLAKGVYKFYDPRMPSFIKLANLAVIPDSEFLDD